MRAVVRTRREIVGQEMCESEGMSVCVCGEGDEMGRENGIFAENGDKGLTMVQMNTAGRLTRFCHLQ
jgi:hypothetical protein